MFGANRITKQNLLSSRFLVVKEVFKTLQGEGPLSGTPSIFVRLGGCPLSCLFCDTEFDNGLHRVLVSTLVDEVVQLTRDSKIGLVVITGGEPMIQNIGPLINALVINRFAVQIETSGAVWCNIAPQIESYGDKVMLVTSPKTPKIAQGIIDNTDYWKYIVKASDEVSNQDGLPLHPPVQGSNSRKTPKTILYRPPNIEAIRQKIFVSPCDEYNGTRNLANTKRAVDTAMRYGYRLSLQQHKILGLP